jgi:hypothetical protein
MALHSLSSDIKHANSKIAEMLKGKGERSADMGLRRPDQAKSSRARGCRSGEK